MKTDKLRIKQVEVSHIGELIRIGEETNLSPWGAGGYIEEMKNSASIMLRLVGDENEIVGFVIGRVVLGGAVETRLDAEIYNIAVTEQFQRRGCGQLLFDEFAKVCRDKRVANIWLEVRESNDKAIRFYEKNGFERVQTRPSFYNDPREHGIVMRLFLKYNSA